MRTTIRLLSCVLIVGWMSLSAFAVGVGLSAGFDPTGLWLVGAATEVPALEYLDVRAQVGFATQGIEGLMLATFSVLPHFLAPPLDPFVGLGIGVAMTPPPFSTGFVVEGSAGLRIVPVDSVSLFVQVRYLMRYAASIWSTGPVYEGGITINF